ncbi:hypothetical protein PFISCL1PPCAC_91, partial [Pristionchus fissidentatus]
NGPNYVPHLLPLELKHLLIAGIQLRKVVYDREFNHANEEEAETDTNVHIECSGEVSLGRVGLAVQRHEHHCKHVCYYQSNSLLSRLSIDPEGD